MKISIFSKTKEGAWGGGNQFLKTLRAQFVKDGIYCTSPKEADVIIFNGYQDMLALIYISIFCNRKKIIYRLGPVLYLHRGIKWKIIDILVIQSANFFSDLVIFQSQWSYKQAINLGLRKKKNFHIITNSVDQSIFFRKEYKQKKNNEPIRLIYSSWSSNLNKGFNYLKFLDDNLDFSKYSFRFIGNSPYIFKNIEIHKPMSSSELAKNLRMSDVFISPIKDDACSNALLEALSSGLPVVALDSGGNSELVGLGGKLFSNEKELLFCIDEISRNLAFYQDNIKIKDIGDVSKEYIDSIKKICVTIKNNV